MTLPMTGTRTRTLTPATLAEGTPATRRRGSPEPTAEQLTNAGYRAERERLGYRYWQHAGQWHESLAGRHAAALEQKNRARDAELERQLDAGALSPYGLQDG